MPWNPAHARRQAGVGHHPGGELCEVAQGNRMHGADMVVHLATVLDQRFAATTLQLTISGEMVPK